MIAPYFSSGGGGGGSAPPLLYMQLTPILLNKNAAWVSQKVHPRESKITNFSRPKLPGPDPLCRYYDRVQAC